MKRHFLLLSFSLIILSIQARHKITYTIDKIWDNGMYCSFTSLIKYKGNYYCSFREGESHIFDHNGKAEGKVRVLRSKNGRKWESVLLAGEPGIDLRDPKLSITSDGRLMICAGGSVYQDKQFISRHSYVMFYDGKEFSEPIRSILDSDPNHKADWNWRVTWHKGTGYVVDYYTETSGKPGMQLMSTQDGIHYHTICQLNISNSPGETTIRFLSDDRMVLMVRRDAGDGMGYWGVSPLPYTDWNFTQMEMRLGGPDFLILDDDHAIASTRSHYTSACKTVMLKGNPQTGKFQEVLVVPSGGDTSYGGLLVEGDEVWMSYYSTHEAPYSCIYLAKVPLSLFKEEKNPNTGTLYEAKK